MNFNSVWKGISIGTIVGSAVFMLMRTTGNQKKHIRKDAVKTLKSAKSLMDDISSVVM